MKPSDAAPEVQKLGPYQLGVLLGEGGMGEVYKAFDDRLGRWVAAKRVRGDGAERAVAERARERFRREARTLAQLGHPAIVQIFDIVEDDGGDWIVMELIDGPTLAELRRDGPLQPGLVLDYGRQIASALGAAHASGVVHRDLKTENVMVLPTGHIKVLDFGLARRLASASAHASSLEQTLPEGKTPLEDAISNPGRIVGTPRAMSPEQASGHEVGPRSDLFSLGVLLYEVLTARLPFAARTLHETLRRVVVHQPPPVHKLCPLVPRRLSELVDRLLEKEPGFRPPSAAAVEEELVAILAGAPVSLMALRRLSQIETLGGSIQVDGPAGDAPSDPPAENHPDHNSVVVTTLLVSDLVGSTRLVEELGDRRAAELFRRHDRLARDLLEEHGGREIDKTDGFLLLFDRPWRAVCYALAYHAALEGLELAARVGIHLGEVILHCNSASDVARGAKQVEVEGLAKPTAARLMSLAVGGQTLLTRAAHDVARRGAASEGDGALEWPAHGRYQFQGIAEAVEVFEVGMPEKAPLERPADSAKVRRVGPSPSLDRRLAAARADLQPGMLLPSKPRRAAVTLRSWPPPELPEQPYPVLLPYTHPDHLAGRDAEISCLWRMLEMPLPLLGLAAPSGTGKSSLLQGGLVPLLRAAGIPTALVRHPTELGVAARLVGDLLVGADLPAEDEAPSFVERLVEVEGLAGTAPVLVIDQFEDVLDSGASEARRVLGKLMASSVARRPGVATPPCRWLLAYRREFHGPLRRWLGDVLAEARMAGDVGLEALPHDLSVAERFHSKNLAPLATPSPGAEDPLAESTRVFLAAIEAPLGPSPPGPLSRGRERGSQSPSGEGFCWHFRAGHAERLARAFAEARQARPDDPLAPELQVVLARLLDWAGPDGEIVVPDDPGPLIDQALDAHLHRVLERVFPSDVAESSIGRARALLALRELATSTGRRDEGASPEQLTRALGAEGETILDQLATPLSRLVMLRETPDGLRWVLAHDRMAEAVVRLVEREGKSGGLVIDGELLALRRFVTLRSELFHSGEVVATSTRVSRRRARRIEAHAEALLWDERRRSWFAACRARGRTDQRRLATLVTVAVLIVGLAGWGTRSWAERVAEHRVLLEQVAGAKPDVAFRALDTLTSRPEPDLPEILHRLKRRERPMDVLEWGLGGLDEPRRSAAVLRAVELALGWVDETPEDPRLIANLVSALDYSPMRDPTLADEAQTLRDRVLQPLRRSRPPPPMPQSDDPDWIHVPAGKFLMGTGPDEEGQADERPQHEVTVAAFRLQRHEVTVGEYRRLVPDHQPGADEDLPAVSVNWYAAYTYAAWLGGRLPTEAEWEYAARADCPFAYCDREGEETEVDAVAWTQGNAIDPITGQQAPQPVMGLEPNPWGLHDMLGNLWEWIADDYAQYPEQPRDHAFGPSPSGGRRMFRGGSFRRPAPWTRVADRRRASSGYWPDDYGLRVLLCAGAESGRPER